MMMAVEKKPLLDVPLFQGFISSPLMPEIHLRACSSLVKFIAKVMKGVGAMKLELALVEKVINGNEMLIEEKPEIDTTNENELSIGDIIEKIKRKNNIF